jgi:Ni/Fe-hydrogenase subunit HybB-like protein
MPTIGYADKPTTKEAPWHALVVWDLLFNNLAAGSFLVSAIGELVAPNSFRSVANIAYPIALVFLIADLACLVIDLGDPWRFHHMLRVFKPSSPMSLGTWCLTAFSLPLTILAAMSVFGIELRWLRTVTIVSALLPALGTAVYKGVLFSTSAQPGWKDARWLGAYLANSALTLGCALCLGVAIGLGQTQAVTILRLSLALLLTLNYLVSWALTSGMKLPVAAGVMALRSIAFAVAIALLAIGGSTPIVIAIGVVLLVAIAVRYEIVDWPRSVNHSG